MMRDDLHEAASAGDMGAVEALLDADHDPTAKDKDGRTPLHLAAMHGHVAVVAKLSSESDIDARDLAERTPFLLAALHGHADAMLALLEQGCDPSATDAIGFTAAHLAACEGYDPDVLLSAVGTAPPFRAESTPLCLASEAGDLDAVTGLLRLGANPDLADDDGMTALHRAAAGGRTDVAEALVSCNASVDARDAAGRTPTHLAALGGHPSMMEFLVRCGADPHAVSFSGAALTDFAEGGV